MNSSLSTIACACVLFVMVAQEATCGQVPPDFEGEVAPLIIRRCLECHQSENAAGGLSLDSAAGLYRGGDSGVAVVRRNADDSLLMERLHGGEMPPEKHGDSQKLPEDEIAVFREWINGGAEFPGNRRLDLYERTSDVRAGRDWWSLQPVAQVVPPVGPQPQHSDLPGPSHPIDRFIAVDLRRNGLTPAPPAAVETLVRRLYWDLTGLPASLTDIARVAENPDRNAALQELIDRLLDSPQFGERWARHWLDVVRFAETSGYERDQPKPFAWKYRDWVVNAFNSDMPYDQFVREQIAGDEIPHPTEQSVTATGFLRLGTWNDEPNDAEDYKYERLEDLVHTTSSAFLAMTIKCARCHDHKFDPIPQADYYRMAAVFWPGPIEARSRDLLGGPTTDELGFADVLGWTDITRTPKPLHRLKNGERHAPMEAVEAGSMSFQPSEFRRFVPADAAFRTSKLRLQLAEWLTSEQNPLTARVIVNRLWQHHFGEGLVRSSSNFGFTGDKPTHPELLDWLANELIRSGWSLKHIHRLILTSATWQQASLHPDEKRHAQVDAANKLLWRAHRRRKEAEALRDAFLAATGELQYQLGGPGFYPTISPDALEGLSRKASAWIASPDKEQHRRSLYMYTQRSLLPPMMTVFDMCDTTLSCGQRDVTIVAPQALTLLNNDFVHRRADAIATRILEGDSGTSGSVVTPHQVRKVWQLILNRDPSPQELEISVRHVAEQHVRFRETEKHRALHQARAEGAAEGILKSAVLWLEPSEGVEADSEGFISVWKSLTGRHHAAQPVVGSRPRLVANAAGNFSAVRFNGAGQFLNLEGNVLKTDEATVFAVVTDSAPAGHRELLSNWSGKDGNSVTSFFVGLTGQAAVRLSDAVSGVGEIQNRQTPFLLTATNGPEGAAVFQQQRPVFRQPAPLPSRRLDTPWVIGQQGNIGGEYWKGDVLQLVVFDRQLSDTDRRRLQTSFARRFKLPEDDEDAPGLPTPLQNAIASLSVVLFNSNEFAYVD